MSCTECGTPEHDAFGMMFLNILDTMLIVIEGLDGSGKSTQVKRLRTYLESKCPNLEYIHFPRYDSPVYGELIGKFLRGDFGAINEVHPQLVALLYAEDRHAAAPEMWKTLNDGGIVLLDRYVYSNIAYQCAKMKDAGEREKLRKWIFDTEYGQFGLPKPDLNIFLDVRSVSWSRNSRIRATGMTGNILPEGAISMRRTSISRRPCGKSI